MVALPARAQAAVGPSPSSVTTSVVARSEPPIAGPSPGIGSPGLLPVWTAAALCLAAAAAVAAVVAAFRGRYAASTVTKPTALPVTTPTPAGTSSSTTTIITAAATEPRAPRRDSHHRSRPDPLEPAAAPDASPSPAKSLEEEDGELAATFSLPAAVAQRNAALADELRGELILAPLTRGNHAPFRKLCLDLGCRVTMSEMAFARQLLKGDRVERTRLNRAQGETCYGFQVATKTIAEGLAASKLAQEHGARWMDLNCGCPIYEATRRGLGAAMLRKPRSLAKLVHGMVRESELPITVKIRLGENEKKVNVERVVRLLSAAGAAAVTVHGRTMEQRYRKPADWDIISRVTSAPGSAPIIGNGDVLSFYEAQRRLKGSGCLAVMVGRGALIKPWIFKEVREGRELSPSAAERVSMYRQFYSLMRSHFGDDERGRKKAWYFAPWHHSFFHRYRHKPEALFGAQSQQQPLISTRSDLLDPLLGEESLEGLDPVERLLRNENEAAHEAIASVLWESSSDADALSALRRLGLERSAEWEQEVRGANDRGGGSREDGDDRG